MKSWIVSFVFAFLLIPSVNAQTVWKVSTVPNTRLNGDHIHVSDPDGYLSDSIEEAINTTLSSIRSQADVFVVTLTSIGNQDPKSFATTLFNEWGIGDAETNNGVLLLFVEDQHALEFETGYGAEEILTDARCSRIFNETIVPYFRNGDYEGGLCAGIGDIVTVYGGEMPLGLVSRVNQPYDDEEGDSEDEMNAFSALFLLLILIPVPILSFFRWILSWIGTDKTKKNGFKQTYEWGNDNGVCYVKNLKTEGKTSVWEGKGFQRFLLYGVLLVALYVGAIVVVQRLLPDVTKVEQWNWITGATLLVYFTFTAVIQNSMLLKKAKKESEDALSPCKVYEKSKQDFHSVLMRVIVPWVGVPFSLALKRKIRNTTQMKCPYCSEPMWRDDSYALSEIQSLEQRFKAYNYQPCRCASGHVAVIQEQGSHYKSLYWCSDCHARIVEKMFSKTVKQPTYTSTGIKETTYQCPRCQKRYVKTSTIAKLVRSSSSSFSGSSRSYSSRSSSSHGSFGGGRSGGGGYSGRW